MEGKVWKEAIKEVIKHRIESVAEEEEPMNHVKIDVLISKEELQKRIAELGQEISHDYKGKELHIVCILKGGVYLAAGLSNYITVPVTMDFMSVSSYGDEMTTTGNVKIKKDLEDDISGRHVLVIEDIIDTGITLSRLIPFFSQRNPASLKICTLLDKPDRRKAEVKVDYRGFEIPDQFVVGYGMDYKQKYRNLPYIGVVREEKK